jgi:serine/threonine-protein kinase
MVQTDALIGTVIADRYRIERLLGAGGMGAVYEATQLSMNRQVALKLLLPQLAQSEQAGERFVREMQATSKISHQHTIQVYDFGQTADNRLFLAMELCRGHSLRALCRKGPVPVERAAWIALQVARALNAAHQEGIAHRDLKPENIMLLDRYGEGDFVKVLDFGIARFLTRETQTMTADGALLGTPLYMSPEQASSHPVDHRTDLYALGVILYEMLSGRPPFMADAPLMLLMQHVNDPPKPLDELIPGQVPAALDELVMAMLAKRAEQRPSSALEVAERLVPFAGQATTPPLGALTPQLAITGQASRPPGKPNCRRPFWWRMRVGILGVLAAAGTTAGLWYGGVLGRGPAGSAPEAPSAADARVVAQAEAALPEGEPDPEPRPEPAPEVIVVTAPQTVVAEVGPETVATAETWDAGPAALATLRATLEELLSGEGYPVAPLKCQTSDPEALRALVEAARRLVGGSPGSARPADEEALGILMRSAKPGPGYDPEYLALLARARLQAGASPQSALEAAQPAAEACPGYAHAHYLVGASHHLAQRVAEASQAYQRTVGLAPSFAAPRFNLALIAVKEKRYDEASRILDELLAVAPRTRNAHMMRGKLLLAKGAHELAAADLRQHLEAEPSDRQAWLALGTALQQMGDASHAKEALCKAKALGEALEVSGCP